MEMLKNMLAWLMARFGEWSTLHGAVVVLGALVVFGLLTAPIFKTIAAFGLAGLGAYLIVMSRD